MADHFGGGGSQNLCDVLLSPRSRRLWFVWLRKGFHPWKPPPSEMIRECNGGKSECAIHSAAQCPTVWGGIPKWPSSLRNPVSVGLARSEWPTLSFKINHKSVSSLPTQTNLTERTETSADSKSMRLSITKSDRFIRMSAFEPPRNHRSKLMCPNKSLSNPCNRFTEKKELKRANVHDQDFAVIHNRLSRAFFKRNLLLNCSLLQHHSQSLFPSKQTEVIHSKSHSALEEPDSRNLWLQDIDSFTRNSSKPNSSSNYWRDLHSKVRDLPERSSILTG
jgi:hypothetical protein